MAESRDGKGHSSAIVSQVVRVLMALHGESHADIAAAIGVTRPAVSARMNLRTPWSLEDLDRLASHYGEPVDTFLRPPTMLQAVALTRGGPLLDPRGRRRRRARSGDRQAGDTDGSGVAVARVRGVPATAAPAYAFGTR